MDIVCFHEALKPQTLQERCDGSPCPLWTPAKAYRVTHLDLLQRQDRREAQMLHDLLGNACRSFARDMEVLNVVAAKGQVGCCFLRAEDAVAGRLQAPALRRDALGEQQAEIVPAIAHDALCTQINIKSAFQHRNIKRAFQHQESISAPQCL